LGKTSDERGTYGRPEVTEVCEFLDQERRDGKGREDGEDDLADRGLGGRGIIGRRNILGEDPYEEVGKQDRGSHGQQAGEKRRGKVRR
jgi:hypothetical protein